MEMLTLEAFEAASEKVLEVTQETKLVESSFFSDATGNRVFFKPENMQRTGAYKVRGAYWKISTLSQEERDRIFTVSVMLPDRPGELVRVASIIAENRGNVIRLDHNQFVTANRAAAVELRVTIEAFGTAHKDQIVKALDEAGLRPTLGQAVI